MLKTNSKKARQNGSDYIREAISDPETIASEYCCYQANAHPALSFGDWLVNYYCALDIYYDDQRATIARVLEESPEEASAYTDDAVHKLYLNLVSRWFCEAFGYEIRPAVSRRGEYVPILKKA